MPLGASAVVHNVVNFVLGFCVFILGFHWVLLLSMPLGPRLEARMEREKAKREHCMRKRDMVCTDFHERRLEVLQGIYKLNKHHL